MAKSRHPRRGMLWRGGVDPLNASLKGACYGLFYFTVLAVEVPGEIPESGSDKSLYDLGCAWTVSTVDLDFLDDDEDDGRRRRF